MVSTLDVRLCSEYLTSLNSSLSTCKVRVIWSISVLVDSVVRKDLVSESARNAESPAAGCSSNCMEDTVSGCKVSVCMDCGPVDSNCANMSWLSSPGVLDRVFCRGTHRPDIPANPYSMGREPCSQLASLAFPAVPADSTAPAVLG